MEIEGRKREKEQGYLYHFNWLKGNVLVSALHDMNT